MLSAEVNNSFFFTSTKLKIYFKSTFFIVKQSPLLRTLTTLFLDHVQFKIIINSKQVAINCYEILKEGLQNEAIKIGKIDPCLLLGSNTIMVTSVDDYLFFGKNREIVKALIQNFKKKLQLTDGGPDTNTFLEIKVEKDKIKGTMTMSQLVLTK